MFNWKEKKIVGCINWREKVIKIEMCHLDWDKLKRKVCHLDWDKLKRKVSS